jgi:hypothetical protein
MSSKASRCQFGIFVTVIRNLRYSCQVLAMSQIKKPWHVRSTPYTLHPTLYTLHPTHTLHLALCTLYSKPYTLIPPAPTHPPADPPDRLGPTRPTGSAPDSPDRLGPTLPDRLNPRPARPALPDRPTRPAPPGPTRPSQPGTAHQVRAIGPRPPALHLNPTPYTKTLNPKPYTLHSRRLLLLYQLSTSGVNRFCHSSVDSFDPSGANRFRTIHSLVCERCQPLLP